MRWDSRALPQCPPTAPPPPPTYRSKGSGQDPSRPRTSVANEGPRLCLFSGLELVAEQLDGLDELVDHVEDHLGCAFGRVHRTDDLTDEVVGQLLGP